MGIDEAILIMENERPHCGDKLTFTEEERYEAYTWAIGALKELSSAQPDVTDTNSGDMVSKRAAVSRIMDLLMLKLKGRRIPTWDEVYQAIYDLPSAERSKDKWIPIKWHYITDEEREESGYPKDWVYFLDCEMPEDGQEIIVTTKHGYVEKDVCYLDDGYSLDSGWDWREDIVAWMPMPEPWKDGEEE